MKYYFVERTNGVGQKATATQRIAIDFEPNEKDFIKEMNISVGDTVAISEAVVKKYNQNFAAFKILEREFIMDENDILIVVFEVEDVTISYKKRNDVFGKLNFTEEVPDIYSLAKKCGIIKC